MNTITAHATGRPSKEEIAEMWREERDRLDRPLTPEEVERGLALIAELRRFREELLAERGGVPFEPGWKLLNESREERTRQLGG